MSTFGKEIKKILGQIGKSDQWLADQTHIGKATISEWQSNPDRIPLPSSIKRIAHVLEPYGVTVEALSEAAGYYMTTSKNASARMERLERLAAEQPRVLDQMEKIARLPQDEQEEVARLLEAWYATRPRQSLG